MFSVLLLKIKQRTSILCFNGAKLRRYRLLGKKTVGHENSQFVEKDWILPYSPLLVGSGMYRERPG